MIVKQPGDGNGAAGPHVDSLLLEDLLHRLGGGFDVTVLGRDHGGGRRADHAHLGRDAAGRELLDVSGVLPDDLFRVHVRDQPHADLGRGDGGNHRFGALAREAAADAVHFERWPRPKPLQHREAFFTDQGGGADFLLQEFLFLEREPLPGIELLAAGPLHPAVETGNPYLAVRPLEPGDDFGQGLHGIGSGAAVHAGMKVVSGAARLELGVNQAAQACGNGRQPGREHLRVADQRRVGLEPLPMFRHVLLDVLAAYLFLAFDQELDVDRQPAFGLHEALDRFEEEVGLPLVVNRAAGVDVLVAYRRLERGRNPFVERVRRLHVVVPVDKKRRLARELQPLPIHQRVLALLAVDNLDPSHSHRAELARDKLGRAPHVASVLRQRADARNLQQAGEPLQKPLAVRPVVFERRSCHCVSPVSEVE